MPRIETRPCVVPSLLNSSTRHSSAGPRPRSSRIVGRRSSATRRTSSRAEAVSSRNSWTRCWASSGVWARSSRRRRTSREVRACAASSWSSRARRKRSSSCAPIMRRVRCCISAASCSSRTSMALKVSASRSKRSSVISPKWTRTPGVPIATRSTALCSWSSGTRASRSTQRLISTLIDTPAVVKRTISS